MLNYNSNASTNSLHNLQIEIICEQVKNDLEKWQKRWTSSIFDTKQSEQAFNELIQYIESGFGIMSTIFKHVSVMIT
jgi:hypothetical protein